MATTVLGGLATSTLLNLLVLLGFVERATPAESLCAPRAAGGIASL